MLGRREVSSFPLSPLQKSRLYTAGYLCIEDVRGVSSKQLSKDTGLSQEECQRILEILLDSRQLTKPRSAYELLHEELSTPPIITFSEKLDSALGGGVHIGRLTEFAGVPGSGKTQLCFQLAVDVRVPPVFGGVGGEVIFIDTKGTFIVDRFQDFATAALKHCHHVTETQGNKEMERALHEFTMETILAGVHYFGCHDYKELLATIQILPDVLRTKDKVKLVIVDSVSFHFRDFDDMWLRTRILTSLGQTLLGLAKQFNLAVVVSNQMTTKVRHNVEGGSWLVPALGESWGHCCTVRVVLQQEGNRRLACVNKSPIHPPTTAPFQISSDGIRDVLEKSQSLQQEEEEINPTKRQRLG